MTPPTPAMAEEGRETRLPALPSGGPLGSPSRSELEVSGGDMARREAEGLPVGHEIEIVEVSSNGEAGDRMEPPVPS